MPLPLILAQAPSFGLLYPFLRLGFYHILTGYDHLMFVFGMLLVCRRWQTILAIVVSFSVAHSLTLILSTLQLVELHEKIAEPLISFSLVIVGTENLLRRGAEPRWRWTLALAFGLVHGFGFAAGLREMGIGTNGGSILVPLLGFNSGVELGQITAGAVVLPILWQLRRSELFVRYGIPLLSAAVAGAGVYWTVQRISF
jgi:hydrogenase/urease accessory protein HupE